MERVPPAPGLYCLVLRSLRPAHVSVGSLGECGFEPGIYVYVGSARGSGGLRSRIRRHLDRRKPRRWHIDYLTTSQSFKILAACFGASTEGLETQLVADLLKDGLRPSIAHFGNTDDPRAPTHLLSCKFSWASCRLALSRTFCRRFRAWSIVIFGRR